MAKASKKPAAAPQASRRDETAPRSSLVLRVFDTVFRFLASLKLAVLTLAALATALAYATIFERNHGTAAAQEYVYQTRGFSVLLAFLGANILCAALIRFPWKTRQIGFVVTHAGLLLLLVGCWYAKVTSDEGQVAISEGDVKDEVQRNDQPVVRVRQVNPDNPQETPYVWELPFLPGAFAWGPGNPRPYPLLNTFNPFSLVGGNDSPREVLTKPKDPFQLVATSHIPASAPARQHLADPSGLPMAKIRVTFKAPGMHEAREMFQDDEERWFTPDRRINKFVRSAGPAQVSFSYVDRPELVDDFLNPPADPGNDGAARFRYADKSGKTRTHDWKLDGQEGKSITLTDSDLTVKYLGRVAFPAAEGGLTHALGAAEIPLAEFEVSKAGGAVVKHFALAGLPMFPNVIPTAAKPTDAPPQAMVSISYDLPPTLESKGAGLLGSIELLGTDDGALRYRVWGRGDPGKTLGQIRSKGELRPGQEVAAFGGGPGSGPVAISFGVDEYLARGVEKEICEPVVLPRGQMGNGLAASRVEMTVTGPDGNPVTRDFYIRRSPSYDPAWQTVTFPGAAYQVAYDVDRRPLGFELKLIDFDRTFDPGTEQASRFQSDVRLTDKEAGIVDRPYRIQMNDPLIHRGYRFYQSSYVREQDPRTGQETGRVQSVLQVGRNPGRATIYSGCILVVLGAFLQFIMRSGLFSDGGRRERARAAARQLEAARKRGEIADPHVVEAAFAAGVSTRVDHDDEPL
jgi:ResB-like family